MSVTEHWCPECGEKQTARKCPMCGYDFKSEPEVPKKKRCRPKK